MSLIISNLGTMIVALVIIAVVAAIVIGLRKDKKAGKSSCGCGCEGCAMKGRCRSASAENR